MKQCSNETMKKGFILLEVLIAVSIIVSITGGAFVLIWQTAGFTDAASSRLTASYLCQEGLELARHIRDSNWLKSRTVPDFAWDNGLPAGEWEMDYNDSALMPYSSSHYLKVGQFYNYDQGVPSPFRRKITISKTSNVISVSVEVLWTERGRAHEFTVAEELYNGLQL